MREKDGVAPAPTDAANMVRAEAGRGGGFHAGTLRTTGSVVSAAPTCKSKRVCFSVAKMRNQTFCAAAPPETL